MDLSETSLWWTQQHHQQQQPMLLVEPTSWSLHHHQPPWFNSQIHENSPHYNLKNIEDEELDTTATTTVIKPEDEKEPMFEKPLTPSDVGKLNRLVIPKQYAEKYFPLGGADSAECKGLLLSFEDESGKCWRFRYSYWNSSQSYVLTKGWSRYVKDKRLDAGDVVLFERHRVDSQRLFINWRRRSGDDQSAYVSRGVGHHGKGSDGNGKNEVVNGVGWSRGFYSAHVPYPAHHQVLPYQHDQCLHAGRGSQSQNQRTKPVGNSSSSTSSSRVLRLFGVNMECQPEHDSSTPQCSYDSNNMPLTQGTLDTYQYHQPSNSHPHVVRHQPYYY